MDGESAYKGNPKDIEDLKDTETRLDRKDEDATGTVGVAEHEQPSAPVEAKAEAQGNGTRSNSRVTGYGDRGRRHVWTGNIQARPGSHRLLYYSTVVGPGL